MGVPFGYKWRTAEDGEVYQEAIEAGVDKDDGQLFLGRAEHNGEIIPGKIVPNHSCCYVGQAGKPYSKKRYEVLCRNGCRVSWLECTGGDVPSRATPAGRTASNETLYFGRVFHDGTLTPGNVYPSRGGCFITYGYSEIKYTNYEVLVLE